MHSKYHNNQLQQPSLHVKRNVLWSQIRTDQIEKQKVKKRQLSCKYQSFQQNGQLSSQQVQCMSEKSLIQQISEMSQGQFSSAFEKGVLAYMENAKYFSQQFRNEFTKISLENEHLRINPYILRSLSFLICKFGEIEIFQSINIQNLMQSLLFNNSRQSSSQVGRLEETLLFITCLVKVSSEQKAIIQSLQKYWKMVSEVGLKNKEYLQLATICCEQGFFYLTQSQIKIYLQLQYQQNEQNTGRLSLICKLLGFYFTNRELSHLMHQLLGFVCRILTSEQLKRNCIIEVVELVVIVYQNLDPQARTQLTRQLLNSRLMQNIVNFSGSSNNQKQRKSFISLVGYFLRQLSADQISDFAFSCGLIESLNSALDLPFKNQQISTVLQSLILLVGSNQSNPLIARNLSLLCKLQKLQLCCNVKISQLASLLLQWLSNQE